MNTNKYSIFVNLLIICSTFAMSSHTGEWLECSQEGSLLLPSDLVGTWKVDLRPTPDAAPYYEYLNITKVEDGQISGTYYNSPIQYGNINTDWGTVVIAFVTMDAGGNTYNTSIQIDGYSMKGTTHSIGRDFLSVWTGEKLIEE